MAVPKGRIHLYCLLFAIPLALVVTEIRQYSRNTLSENGRWVSVKPLMQIGLVGAHHFVLTRNALAGNRLDLGAWHGYNEVYFDTPLRLGTVETSFRLDGGAYLSVIMARTAEGFVGVRFSRNGDFPSMLFRGERSGQFTETIPIEGLALDDAWHQAKIEMAEGSWLVSLDGAVAARFEAADAPLGWVGFRSGFYRAEVDDVRISDAAGRPRLDERFRNRQGYWLRLATSLALAYAVLLIVARLAARSSRDGGPQPIHWVALVCLVTTFGAGLFLAFDMKVWSRSYFYKRHVPEALKGPASIALVRFESWRQSLLGIDSEQLIEPSVDPLTSSLTRWDFATPFTWPGPRPWHRFVVYSSRAPGKPHYFDRDRLLAVDPETPAIRIAFLGSSSTVGAGAETLEGSIVSRIHRSLSTRLEALLADQEKELQAFNLAVQSSEAPLQLLTFERFWNQMPLDLVVITLSYNDRDPALFASSLERFAEVARPLGIDVVFVVEAFGADIDDPAVREKQRLMRQVGAANGVAVLDLAAYMDSPPVRDSGFLWWDPVHMSTYGQNVAADWLTEQITPFLTGPD